MILDIISTILLLCGCFLGLTGAWGLFRLPDFYTRVHAASITDTLCAACFVLGMMLQTGWTLTTVKLLMILLLLWLTSPTSSHALVKAAQHAGLHPLTWTKEGGKS